MPTALDRRLASIWHRDRIDPHADVERGVGQIDRPFGDLLRALVGLASDPPADLALHVERVTAKAFHAAEDIIRARFQQIAKAAHRRATDGLVATIPRKWFRVLGVFREKIADEPVTKPMSDAAWRRELASITFRPPSAEEVAEMLNHKGPGGLAWDERLGYWSGAARERIKRQLQIGIGQAPQIRAYAALYPRGDSGGESLLQVRKRLEETLRAPRYQCQRIARTEGRRVAELSQQRTIQQAGDLIAAQEIIATLDANTDPEHALRHGKRYDRQPDGSFVASDGEHAPDLPDRANCRCFLSAVLAMPGEFAQNAALAADFANATAETIPDPSAYVQWFTGAEEPQRIAAVGVRRYRMARKRLGRQPEWTDFLQPDGKLVSAKRLRSESLADWEARRAAVEQVIRQREALLKRAAA